MAFHLVDGDSNESSSSNWIQPLATGKGVSKDMGEAISYAVKNFLMRTFMISPEGDTDLDLSESAHTAQPKQKPAPKVDSKAEIEQASINQAKKDLLQKLSEDPTIRSAEYYPNYNHLVNTMKKYKDEFGTEALDDGFVAVVANLINRKHPEVEQS